MGWTVNQAKAIKERGTNILVSAGAGSGKTSVLTARVLSLLETENIDQMLILTFTTFAATEMKRKIRDSLQDKIKKGETRLMRQLSLLNTANIQTFDSFTYNLVNQYKLKLNIANVGIIDQALKQKIKIDAANKALIHAFTSNNPVIFPLLEDLDSIDKEEIITLIIDANDKLANVINKKLFLINYVNDFFSDNNYQVLLKKYYQQLNIVKKDINQLIKQGEKINDERFLNYLEKLKIVLDFSFEQITALPALPRFSCDNKNPEYASAKNINKLIKKTYKFLQSLFLSDVKQLYFDQMREKIKGLIYLIKIYDKILFDLKKECGLFEYSDISMLTIALLEENKDILQLYKSRFRHIIVDETQDNNNLNEYIISLLSDNNVYAVGDIKQSIYRFRDSNPQLFKEKYSRYRKGKGGIKIDFRENFRSRSEVTTFINIIFSAVMDLEFGGADYSKEHCLIAANPNYLPTPGIGSYILNYNNTQLNRHDCVEVEAFVIAKEIKRIVNTVKVSNKDGSLRPLRYSDICILAATKDSFAIVEKVLGYHNIPANKSENNSLIDLDFHPLLSIILLVKYYQQTPDDQSLIKLELYSLLRSFLFAYSDERIINCLFFDNKDQDIADVIAIIKNYSQSSMLVNELLVTIINDFSYLEKLHRIGQFRASVNKINILLDYVSNKVVSNFFDLDALIDFLDFFIQKKKEGLAQPRQFDFNGVVIMSIHGSKGLEFPVVFIIDNQRLFNFKDLSSSLIYSPDYHFILPALNNNKETILHKLNYLKEKKEIISEKIRLFYVACTRAKEILYIVNGQKELAEDEQIDYPNVISSCFKINFNSFSSIINVLGDKLAPYVVNVEPQVDKKYLTYRPQINLPAPQPLDYQFKKIEQLTPVPIKEKVPLTLSTLPKGRYELLQAGTIKHKYLESLSPEKLLKEIKFPFDLKNPQIYQELIIKDVPLNTFKKIDLLIVDTDIIYLIDYKLANLDEEKYYPQLNDYYQLLKQKYDQQIRVFLYSVFDRSFKEIAIKSEGVVV